MMMGAIMPAGSSEAYALLQVIADPKKAKERLDEIVAREETVRKLLADLEKKSSKAEADRKAAEELNLRLEARKTQLDKQTESITTREVAVAQREDDAKSDIAAKRKELNAKIKEAAERDKQLQAREDALAKTEDRLAKKEAKADDLVVQYEAKLARMREITA